MGVHTGDSVTVAPQMTLSDEAYQELRDAAIAIIRAVGVDTGGSNIQFARAPRERRAARDRDEPARLALLGARVEGDRLPDRQGRGAARGRLHARRDPERPDRHDTGELRADARLRRRQDAALRVREVPGRRPDARHADEVGRRVDGHRPHLRRGVRQGPPRASRSSRSGGPRACTRGSCASSRCDGSAMELARSAVSDTAVAFRRVDSCAGEVEAASNYFYSTRGERDERPPEPGRSVVILGSGPNRIGQGIEFDYCCVHAAQSFRAQGYEAVMVNCNPETVSTDYDTSDRLYFEPLDEEAVLAVLAARAARRASASSSAARRRSSSPARSSAPATGSSARRSTRSTWPRTASASAGSRRELGVRCPEWGIAATGDEAAAIAARVGYPVLVRPSYVLGGRAMRVCYDEADVRAAMARRRGRGARRPLPRERGRARRRRALRRRRHLRRRGDGARRGGGHPLGRLVVRPARRRRDSPEIRDARAPARAGARRRRAAERAARDRRRRGLRPRGEPARLADGAVRVQGDRDQPRRRRLPARRGRDARRARAAARGLGVPRPPREGGGAPVRPLPGRRPGARPGDALDRAR